MEILKSQIHKDIYNNDFSELSFTYNIYKGPLGEGVKSLIFIFFGKLQLFYSK